jgi:hypothetical protein
MRGKKATEETKQKMSESQLTRITPEERQRRSEQAKLLGYGKWMIGKTRSPEAIAKLVVNSKGKNYSDIYGDRAEDEARKRSDGNKHGHNISVSGRVAMGNATRRKGLTYVQIYGPERAKEEVLKRSIAHQKRWESVPRKLIRPHHNGDFLYARWRDAVFSRDNFTCCFCGIAGGELQAHHIKFWSKFPELRYVVENGVTVHSACHRTVHKLLRLGLMVIFIRPIVGD